MSVAGIASAILTAINSSGSHQNRFQTAQSGFQQLGQDLKSGNLSQAASDFTTLSQNFPGLTQNNASTTAANSTSSFAQTFNQLGQDLQSKNLSAAQQDYATLQQEASQPSGIQHHHHRFHQESQNSANASPTNTIAQAFSQLAQTLQSGSLQGAQSAFAALQNDLEQFGGASAATPPLSSGLNVVA